MKIAIITAGGAGMFCGSCMQDNTLARALRHAGHDVTLVPTYTPIRVDEEDVSDGRVFMGGVNVYLDSAVPGWSRLPRFLKSWLDRPGVLRTLTRGSSATDATQLGWLTVDMLKGGHGPQRDEIHQLVSWLTTELHPDMILFSNALLSGIVPSLRQAFAGPILCLLQGDDIFLDALQERWKQRSLDLIRDNSQHFNRLLTHSNWYADHLSTSIGLPREQFEQIPLSLDCQVPKSIAENPIRTPGNTIGYFARICPEKGVDNFLNAAERLAPMDESLQFHVAGFLPDLHQSWFQTRLAEVRMKIGEDRLLWLGSPATREEKFVVLNSFDLLCVPSNYREPKGLFLLEAALVGLSSLVPHHGAFPERIAELGQGSTYDPNSNKSLDDGIRKAIAAVHEDRPKNRPQNTVERFSIEVTGPKIGRLLQSIHSEAFVRD
jgi:glycosyltransferase involved in cell wall biosynthesis